MSTLLSYKAIIIAMTYRYRLYITTSHITCTNNPDAKRK